MAKQDIKYVDVFNDEYLASVSPEKQEQIKNIRNGVMLTWDKIFDIKDSKYVQGVTWVLEKKHLDNIINFNVSEEELQKWDAE